MPLPDIHGRTTSVVLVVVVAVTLAPALAGSVGAGGSLEADVDELPHTSVAVTQNGQCWEVSPYGQGTRNVSDFYDYRSPESNPPGEAWGSYGTQDLQRNQTSMLLFYEGSGGLSMVMLHDELGEPYGGTITFELFDLPESGQWVVEDDPYASREDNWDFYDNGTEADIDWKWSDGRGDGAAFRGVEATNGTPILIEPGFNEQADKWESWGYARGDNRTDAWYLRSSEGGVQELSMYADVEVRAGGCSGGTSPMATLEYSVGDDGQTYQFDADSSYADGTVDSYLWDLDGDDAYERTTDVGFIEHRFPETGLQGVRVTAVAEDGNRSTVTKLLMVNASEAGSNETNTTTPAPNTTTPAPNTTQTTAQTTAPATSTDSPTTVPDTVTPTSSTAGAGGETSAPETTAGGTATDGADGADGGAPGLGASVAVGALFATTVGALLWRRRSKP